MVSTSGFAVYLHMYDRRERERGKEILFHHAQGTLEGIKLQCTLYMYTAIAGIDQTVNYTLVMRYSRLPRQR